MNATQRTLTHATYATLIHGQTGQEVEDCWLDAGTQYELESANGDDEYAVAWILADGYRYKVINQGALSL